MKLMRFGEPGREKPAVILPDGGFVDVSGVISDWSRSTIADDAIARVGEWLAANTQAAPRVENPGRIGPPIADPSKIICIGLNYADHAAESGAKVPSEPVVFMKSTTSLCGPNDDVMIPLGSLKTDWEVELAVVIGRRAKRIRETEAMDYVAGFTIVNDISERSYQLEREGQWVKGKSCDTFSPVGPWIVTPDEVPEPGTLGMWLNVNGEKRQNGSTSTMVYRVPFLISYLSQFMTLLPGDIISTGTPPGVGLGMKPPTYLKAGDVMELGIDGLGTQRQVCVDEKAD
ncbi:MAG: fumarylacetoacetate hydrolase family protein [Candidatus Sumerlaeaceae bacterium]